MIELLCISHRGVRCAVPSKQVLQIEPTGHMVEGVGFWNVMACSDTPNEDRRLSIMTSLGPQWLRAARPVLRQVEQSRIFGLPAVLRDWLPLRHVVGLVDLEEQLVWLVDALRWAPAATERALNHPETGTEGETV